MWYLIGTCRDCKIDAVDSLHHTPLHIAARRNHTSAVKILLEKGADMRLKDDNGDQPIHIAAEAGHYEYVDIHHNMIIMWGWG